MTLRSYSIGECLDSIKRDLSNEISGYMSRNNIGRTDMSILVGRQEQILRKMENSPESVWIKTYLDVCELIYGPNCISIKVVE